MPARPIHQTAVLLLLLVGLLVTYFCYWPGLGADFHFDDRSSLLGLEQVDDRRSALEYVVSGGTGPLGRPLALTSFLLINKTSWPNDPEAFLYTNILVHLINGLLVAWLALRLCRARHESHARAGYIAALASTIWMVMPILASTSLLVVQRMTSLSTTFVLIGLVCYLLFRNGIERRPRRALAGMAASLVAFTLLAMLTKENGVLLPVFALVMECTVLPGPRRLATGTWRVWRAVFLWLPLLAIGAMLASMVPYSDATAAMRGFGAWERLLSQAMILWEYLFHAFIPVDVTQLGPFQDTYRASRSILEPMTFLAVAGWLTVVGAAWYWRRAVPLFAFAVFWFLAGHLVESTVVSLDLYFEHRNYLPLIGPVFAIAWLAVHVPRSRRTLAAIGSGAYVAVLAVTLWVVASLWGQPLREAQEQYLAHPTSSRAVGYFGARLLALGAVEPAMLLLDRAIERDVAPERLRVSRLYLKCGHYPDRDGGEDLQRLYQKLGSAAFDRNLAHALYVLTRTRIGRECNAAGIEDIRRLLDSLESNPVYQPHGESQYWLHRARARLAASRGDREERKEQLRLTQEARFDPFVLELWITLQVEDGKSRTACNRLQQLWREAPLNPIKRLHRYLKLKALASELSGQMKEENCRV